VNGLHCKCSFTFVDVEVVNLKWVTRPGLQEIGAWAPPPPPPPAAPQRQLPPVLAVGGAADRIIRPFQVGKLQLVGLVHSCKADVLQVGNQPSAFAC
jgi:hypothetical protein